MHPDEVLGFALHPRLKAEVSTSVSVKGAPVALHALVQDELYRIGYEAIRNACTHAQCSSIHVELSYRRHLILQVIDDGIGMDPSFLANGKPGHYGIIGMRERAARGVLIGSETGKCRV